MLVMQTLHENISNGLPKTAYIKLVDWWLIYGIVVPFLVFLVLVVLVWGFRLAAGGLLVNFPVGLLMELPVGFLPRWFPG